MTTTPVLNLLRDPSHWTKRSSARRPLTVDDTTNLYRDYGEDNAFDVRKHGMHCRPGDPNAVSWCLTGAVDRSHLPQLAAAIVFSIAASINTLYPSFLIEMRTRFGPTGADEPLLLCQFFNDHENTTHEMILRVLEHAQV